jgi:SAM-dependent MidA family methyltransferase
VGRNKSPIPNPQSLSRLITERGRVTVAAFMDLALYHPEFGYYARADQRSGRAGDFFTSVDVGPLFGQLLAIQLAEMVRILNSNSQIPHFDLVEAGAGNARLSADILRAARDRDRTFYDSVRLHLVETSAVARAAQRATLGDVADRLASSSSSLPSSFEGVLIANELLDALPTHQVVMREAGPQEIYVEAVAGRPFPPSVKLQRNAEASAEAGPGRHVGGPEKPALRTVEDKPSTPALADYLARLGVRLEPGWRVEINLRAVEWIRDAARRLRRGFIILIDYGHEARELYSPTHAAGTLTTFSGHRSAGMESVSDAPPWLRAPGEQDITAHVDFTSIRTAAEEEGLTTLGFLDQTYFLLGLIGDELDLAATPERGERSANASAVRNERGACAAATERSVKAFGERDPDADADPRGATASASAEATAGKLAERSRALKTLIMPGGLGSTMKVLILGKGVGTPGLRGCSFRVRVT